ncbi:SemiSWEET family sugar transporter [Flavobacterium piscisymbiosum]|uniref:SemiSWEET transporter n=1 Tax=Flavobacterium piscisymbiosum TaxID=2893753 RepID=A0ABS8MGA3_9FLAO|nr:SemiSWEET transporter [Flavobacterium sp. F-30]MCC9064532.1 SemiSWEET transporter [Flavobacterium sp. F-30]
MNLIDIVGLFAGTCVTISVVPQIIKVWKTKKVKQISLKTFGILTFGILVWIIYGILKKDLPIIITNSVSLCLNLIMVYFIIYYEKES